MFCFCFVIVFRSVFLAFFVSLSRSLQRSLLAAAHPGRILFAGQLFFICTVLFFSTLGVGCCSVLICLVLILDVLVLTSKRKKQRSSGCPAGAAGNSLELYHFSRSTLCYFSLSVCRRFPTSPARHQRAPVYNLLQLFLLYEV